MLYTPIFFSIKVNGDFRFGLMLTIVIFLLMELKKIYTKDIVIMLCLVLIFFISILNEKLNITNLRHTLSFINIIIFGWSLKKYLISNEIQKIFIIKIYAAFTWFVIISSLLSQIYFISIDELDIFGFKSDIYQYLVTPFGILLKKEFLHLSLYRSFFYFEEPIYMGVFCAGNILLLSSTIKDRNSKFKIINYIGGFLTFSATFYILILIYLIARKFNKIKYLFYFILFYFILFFDSNFSMLNNLTSLDDRIQRILFSLDVISDANIFEILFGFGFNHNIIFYKAFNSGINIIIFHYGIVGLILFMTSITLFIDNLFVLIFFIIVSTVINPFFSPLFILMMAISSTPFRRTLS